jgi:hemerythrin-like domain-containing protein
MTNRDPHQASSDSSGSEPANSAVLDFAGVHRMIRGYITKIDAALKNPRNEAAWAKTLAGLVSFGVAGLRFHHHVEDDEYWPALIAKGADANLLEPLTGSHRDLDVVLNQVESVARRLTASPTDTTAMAAVADLMAQFRDHVRQHLDEEEPIIFPLLEQYISDTEAHAMAARAARNAPKKGISWIIGGVTYAMTPPEAENFLSAFPKPIIWLRPLLLRTYRRNCATLGIDPQFS